MSAKTDNLPRVLLVDDSDSVLAFEKAALGNYYRLDTASDGEQALKRLEVFRPDAMVLDLSMPVMDGDEALKRLRAHDDPDLAECGVLVLSTESQRARDCLELGADDFLSKPVDPPSLLARVASCLEAAQRRRENRQAIFLFLETGGHDFALPVEAVVAVTPRCALLPLPGAPEYIQGFFEYYGEPVPVMDLALHLGWKNEISLEERKLVILIVEGRRLALEIDTVRDPEAFNLKDVTGADKIGGTELGHLARFLKAVVRNHAGELVPVLETASLVQPRTLPKLMRALEEALPASAT